MKIYLETLGCAKNLVDSEVMLGFLQNKGYTFTHDPEDARIIIVNTCAFIEEATREAIETILLLARNKQEGLCKHLIVCGCLPQRYKQELLKELPEVDMFLGTGEFQNIVKHLESLSEGDHKQKIMVSSPTFLLDNSTPRLLTTPGSSTYIKIAEGCSHRCTYCSIPEIKGPFKSRLPESVLEEARKLSSQGIMEINLVAQDVTAYKQLPALLRELVKIPEIKWVRLLYCHPANITDELLMVMAGEEKICSYMDIPLQHISDSILKKMARNMNKNKTEKVIERIKTLVPGIALRTTFIVGFPGETDEDFRELLQFANQTCFDHLGAFQYRQEEGTPAAKLGDTIPDKTKKDRYHRLMSQQTGISRNINNKLVGRTFSVLVDNISQNTKYRLQARTQFQGPEVDGVVFIDDDVTIGSFVNIRIKDALTYDLVGEVM